MQQVGVRVTMIAIPPLATDLIGRGDPGELSLT